MMVWHHDLDTGSNRKGSDIGTQALGLTLLAYALPIVPLTMLHQGGFDDPLVFLAVALATSNAAQLLERQKHDRGTAHAKDD